ncbi:MAG TPA: hypothetical protein VJT81_05610 [Burkholderiales bacterium]|nr:hypothetical protein [Burkholderiales bacterium]
MAHKIDLQDEARTLHDYITGIACTMIATGKVWPVDVNKVRRIALGAEEAAGAAWRGDAFPALGDKPDLPRLFADAFARASAVLLWCAKQNPPQNGRRYYSMDGWLHKGRKLRDVRLYCLGAKKGWDGVGEEKLWPGIEKSIGQMRERYPEGRSKNMEDS